MLFQRRDHRVSRPRHGYTLLLPLGAHAAGKLGWLSSPQPGLDVQIGYGDQSLQGRGIHGRTGPQLHVTHLLPVPLEQPHRIRQVRAPKEPDINVSREHVGVGERCITDARGRVTVMQQLPNIGTTIPHPAEPLPRDCTELRRPAVKPRINGRGARDRGRKQQQLTHGDSPATSSSRTCQTDESTTPRHGPKKERCADGKRNQHRRPE